MRKVYNLIMSNKLRFIRGDKKGFKKEDHVENHQYFNITTKFLPDDEVYTVQDGIIRKSTVVKVQFSIDRDNVVKWNYFLNSDGTTYREDNLFSSIEDIPIQEETLKRREQEKQEVEDSLPF